VAAEPSRRMRQFFVLRVPRSVPPRIIERSPGSQIEKPTKSPGQGNCYNRGFAQSSTVSLNIIQSGEGFLSFS